MRCIAALLATLAVAPVLVLGAGHTAADLEDLERLCHRPADTTAVATHNATHVTYATEYAGTDGTHLSMHATMERSHCIAHLERVPSGVLGCLETIDGGPVPDVLFMDLAHVVHQPLWTVRQVLDSEKRLFVSTSPQSLTADGLPTCMQRVFETPSLWQASEFNASHARLARVTLSSVFHTVVSDVRVAPASSDQHAQADSPSEASPNEVDDGVTTTSLGSSPGSSVGAWFYSTYRRALQRLRQATTSTVRRVLSAVGLPSSFGASSKQGLLSAATSGTISAEGAGTLPRADAGSSRWPVYVANSVRASAGAAATLGYTLTMRIDNYNLQLLRFTMDGRLSASAAFDCSTTVSVSGQSRSYSLLDVSSKPLLISVGPVPATLTGVLSVTASGQGRASGTVSAAISAGFAASLELGFEYTPQAGMRPVRTFTADRALRQTVTTVEATAMLQASIEAAVGVELSYVLGLKVPVTASPTLAIEVARTVSTSSGAASDTTYFEMSLVLDVDVSLVADVAISVDWPGTQLSFSRSMRQQIESWSIPLWRRVFQHGGETTAAPTPPAPPATPATPSTGFGQCAVVASCDPNIAQTGEFPCDYCFGSEAMYSCTSDGIKVYSCSGEDCTTCRYSGVTISTCPSQLNLRFVRLQPCSSRMTAASFSHPHDLLQRSEVHEQPAPAAPAPAAAPAELPLRGSSPSSAAVALKMCSQGTEGSCSVGVASPGCVTLNLESGECVSLSQSYSLRTTCDSESLSCIDVVTYTASNGLCTGSNSPTITTLLCDDGECVPSPERPSSYRRTTCRTGQQYYSVYECDSCSTPIEGPGCTLVGRYDRGVCRADGSNGVFVASDVYSCRRGTVQTFSDVDCNAVARDEMTLPQGSCVTDARSTSNFHRSICRGDGQSAFDQFAAQDREVSSSHRVELTAADIGSVMFALQHRSDVASCLWGNVVVSLQLLSFSRVYATANFLVRASGSDLSGAPLVASGVYSTDAAACPSSTSFSQQSGATDVALSAEQVLYLCKSSTLDFVHAGFPLEAIAVDLSHLTFTLPRCPATSFLAVPADAASGLSPLVPSAPATETPTASGHVEIGVSMAVGGLVLAIAAVALARVVLRDDQKTDAASPAAGEAIDSPSSTEMKTVVAGESVPYVSMDDRADGHSSAKAV